MSTSQAPTAPRALRAEIENVLQQAPGFTTVTALADLLDSTYAKVDRELELLHCEGRMVRGLHRTHGVVWRWGGK